MSDRDRDAAVAGAVITAIAAIICLSIGVTMVFGGGWALITIGSLLALYSLVLGLGRKTQNLVFPNNN